MNLSSRQLLFVLLVVGVGAASYSMVREARDPGLLVLATAAAGVVAEIGRRLPGRDTGRYPGRHRATALPDRRHGVGRR